MKSDLLPSQGMKQPSSRYAQEKSKKAQPKQYVRRSPRRRRVQSSDDDECRSLENSQDRLTLTQQQENIEGRMEIDYRARMPSSQDDEQVRMIADHRKNIHVTPDSTHDNMIDKGFLSAYDAEGKFH